MCPATKWYIKVITWARVVCLIYTPSPSGVYIRQTTLAHVITYTYSLSHFQPISVLRTLSYLGYYPNWPKTY